MKCVHCGDINTGQPMAYWSLAQSDNVKAVQVDSDKLEEVKLSKYKLGMIHFS